jgi:hypothetical protein
MQRLSTIEVLLKPTQVIAKVLSLISRKQLPWRNSKVISSFINWQYKI